MKKLKAQKKGPPKRRKRDIPLEIPGWRCEECNAPLNDDEECVECGPKPRKGI